MNTKQLQSYHLDVARQSNKCADILRLISRVNGSIDSISEWLNDEDLDRKMISVIIRSQVHRMEWLKSSVIPRLMSYYQSQLIKLEQIYQA